MVVILSGPQSVKSFLFFTDICTYCLPEGGHNIASETEGKLGQLTPLGIKPNKLWAVNWG